ncbi:MAG: exosortase A [Pseudomonadota bacterium]
MKLEQPPIAAVAATPFGVKAESYAPLLLVSVAILWLLVWYAATVHSMYATWQRSDTFAHGFLIAPISLWLIWRQRHVIAEQKVHSDFIALPLLALAGFAWLLGEVAGVDVVQQFALVSMIPLLVMLVAGRHIVGAIAFPLFFLLFAVPFGDFLLPPLMEHTADFTIAALRLTGIPVFREGLFFTLPSGNWSVVEACSGLRYLIASLTVGVLYAYLMYRSSKRRALFIAAAIAVPIVANWLRAYMIVMIGHLSSMQYAVGVDHLIYGWLFFGVVMLILFWVGALWREDLDRPPETMSNVVVRRPPVTTLRPFIAATVVGAALVATWPGAAAYLDRVNVSSQPPRESPAPAAGWELSPQPISTWTPHFLNYTDQVSQVYATDNARVGLYVRYYRNQHQGAELITSGNTLVRSIDPAWGNTGETHRTVSVNNESLTVVAAELRGPPAKRLLVWRWYRVDGRYTTNPYVAKLLQARSKLLGRGDAGAVIIVYTELMGSREQATNRLEEFVTAMLPGIARSVDYAQ